MKKNLKNDSPAIKMKKKHFEQQFPSLKKNVFWEKQKTSERITEDRIDYENACVDVSQIAKNCIDKQNLKEIPPKSFLIKIPEASLEELDRWKKELSKLNRQEPIFLVNQNFELDTDWIKKDKIKESIERGIESAEIMYTKSAELKDSFSQAAHRGVIYALKKLKKELGLENETKHIKRYNAY